MKKIARLLGIAAIALAAVAYLVFSHVLTVTEHPSTLMLAVGVAPFAAVALLSAWHSPMRWLALSLLAALGGTVLYFLEDLRNHINWLYFAQHAGTMGLLAITFGSTLGLGDENALCSRVTRIMLAGPPDARYMRYTWKITVIWTAYFIITGLTSVLLFSFAPLAVWSFFANLMTPVIVGLMFVIEYFVRIRVLPDREHFSIAATIKAYRAYEQR